MTGAPKRGDPASPVHAEPAPSRPQGARLSQALVGVGYVAIYAAAAIAAVVISFPISPAVGRGDATTAIALTFLAIVLAASLAIAATTRPIKRLLSPTYLAAGCVIPCVILFTYGAIMVAASSFATMDKPLDDWRWTTWLKSFICVVPSFAVALASVSARVNSARPRRRSAVLGGVAVVLLALTAAAVLGVLTWTPRAG